MTDLLYIAMVRVPRHGWTVVSASTDEDDAQHDADTFKEMGYVAKVERTFVRITDEAASRIWRTWQQRCEQEAMNR